MLIIPSLLLAVSFLTQVTVLAAIQLNAHAPLSNNNALFSRTDKKRCTFAWIISQYFDPTLELIISAISHKRQLSHVNAPGTLALMVSQHVLDNHLIDQLSSEYELNPQVKHYF